MYVNVYKCVLYINVCIVCKCVLYVNVYNVITLWKQCEKIVKKMW